MKAVVGAQRALARHEAGAIYSLRASLVDLAAVSEAMVTDSSPTGRREGKRGRSGPSYGSVCRSSGFGAEGDPVEEAGGRFAIHRASWLFGPTGWRYHDRRSGR